MDIPRVCKNKTVYARLKAKTEKGNRGKMARQKEVTNFCLLGHAFIFYLEDKGRTCSRKTDTYLPYYKA
jgi:hypothetical protein